MHQLVLVALLCVLPLMTGSDVYAESKVLKRWHLLRTRGARAAGACSVAGGQPDGASAAGGGRGGVGGGGRPVAGSVGDFVRDRFQQAGCLAAVVQRC